MSGTRGSGDRGAGNARRPQFPPARPARAHDPRVAGRPRALPGGTAWQDPAGPQDFGEIPGYEFEVPRRERGTGEFREVRETDRSGPVPDTGEFTGARDSGGFGRVRDTGGFGPARDAGGPGRVRRPDDFDAAPGLDPVRDRSERGRIGDSGGFGAVRDSGGFDAVRDTGQRRPLTLRYTPRVADSGPMGPVPAPAEFTDPRRLSGPRNAPRPQLRPRPERGPAPRQHIQTRPGPRTAREIPASPATRGHRVLPEPREPWTAAGPSAPGDRRGPRGPLLLPDWRSQPGGDGRPAPRHAAGQRDPGSLDGQRDQRGAGTVRRFRRPADQHADPGLAIRLARDVAAAMRSRNWVTGLAVPILAAIAVGVAVVVVAGANNGNTGPAPSSLAAGFPPARPAVADFTDTRALAGRGIQAPLGQVATFGGTIVAVGAQSGTRIPRARFYVSADNGRTWRLGTVRGDPPPGQAATLVAGGPRGWVAIGPTAVWTSPNARDWLIEPRLPQLAGDKITTLIATGSGFLAAGTNIPGGDAAKASPVVWLSANGTAWQRLGASQLDLTAVGGQVLGITGAAANGSVIVMSGTVAGRAASSGVWRSADGGASWTPVTVPAGGGAGATIAGLAPLRGGFVAVRPATVGGAAGAAVYTSVNGTAWRQSAALKSADGSPLTHGLVSGGPDGAVIAAQAHGLDIAFLSPDGTTWTGTDPAATAAAERISGVALTAAGQAVFSGTTRGDTAEEQPVLTLIGAHGGPRTIAARAIPGALTAQVAVNAIAASGTTQVAAGSADGFPALWVSADGGSTWARAAGATPAVLSRPGDEQLTGVAHGAAGWLAVGGAVGSAAAAQRPVVLGSADGRTWTALDGSAAFAGPGQAAVAAAAAGPAGYVIAGREAAAGGRTVAAAWYAPGLTGWQRAASVQPGSGDSQMNAVAATGNGFVAVGSAGTRPAAWLSATGRAWSLITLPLPGGAESARLSFVAASGGTVAAAGTGVTAAGQRLPFAAVSADGGTSWALAALPAPPGAGRAAAANLAVTALAAAGGGFTATGTYGTPGSQDVGIWTLAPRAARGTAWTAAAPDGTGLAGPGTQAITALAGAGSTLTGAGFTATPAGEQPTIWQSPVRN